MKIKKILENNIVQEIFQWAIIIAFVLLLSYIPEL